MSRTHIDDVARSVVRAELQRRQRSIAEMGRFLGIQQGPANRRLNGDYRWSLSELLVLGDWLGVDLVNLVVTTWRAGEAGAADLDAVRTPTRSRSGEQE